MKSQSLKFSWLVLYFLLQVGTVWAVLKLGVGRQRRSCFRFYRSCRRTLMESSVWSWRQPGQNCDDSSANSLKETEHSAHLRVSVGRRFYLSWSVECRYKKQVLTPQYWPAVWCHPGSWPIRSQNSSGSWGSLWVCGTASLLVEWVTFDKPHSVFFFFVIIFSLLFFQSVLF